ncbi:MAG: dTMP kinase, partial [Candidatus Thermoplasmatota archaeon]
MFITVEGIDGCGKTTVSKALWKELNKIGYKVAYTYEPTDSSIGNLIKKCCSSPFTEAFLFMADRAEHQKWIRKKLEKSFVICDRYMDSTTAYQGEKLK